MDQHIADIADQIFSGMVRQLGARWANGLTDAERAILHTCCEDAAELQVRSLAASHDAETQRRLLREKAHVDAQLRNLGAAGADRVSEAFWEAVRTLVHGAVAIAFAAV